MSLLLFETILVKDKSFQNIFYHNWRLNNTRKELWKMPDIWNLEEKVPIPSDLEDGLFRCRITYNTKIRKIEFIPYRVQNISRLHLVIANEIEYRHKYEDREEINRIKQKVKEGDILIVKNGLISDTSVANIVLKKEKKWFTPYRPLLRGTQREKLIRENSIVPMDIRPEDIQKFETFKLINALRPFNETEEMDCTRITG
jgi:4-amino-4-deoxychorismate lyase